MLAFLLLCQFPLPPLTPEIPAPVAFIEPPNEPAQLVTPAPSVASPAGGVFETCKACGRELKGQTGPVSLGPDGCYCDQCTPNRKHFDKVPVPATVSKEAPAPQAVAQAAHLPAAGGFCTTGNCGPATTEKSSVVRRPQRAGLFRGIFRRR